MNRDDYELVRHEIEAEEACGQTAPPPFAEAPDVAETLRLLERVSRLPAIRFEKVQEMQDLIARGELETPDRIDGTVRRLMEEFGL